MFAHIGELKLIHPLSTISLKASFSSGLYRFFAAAEQILSIAPSTDSP
jgi:hypothetical protein